MRNEIEKEGECGMTAILMAGCEKKEHFVGSGFAHFDSEDAGCNGVNHRLWT